MGPVPSLGQMKCAVEQAGGVGTRTPAQRRGLRGLPAQDTRSIGAADDDAGLQRQLQQLVDPRHVSALRTSCGTRLFCSIHARASGEIQAVTSRMSWWSLRRGLMKIGS